MKTKLEASRGKVNINNPRVNDGPQLETKFLYRESQKIKSEIFTYCQCAQLQNFRFKTISKLSL